MPLQSMGLSLLIIKIEGVTSLLFFKNYIENPEIMF